MCPCLLEIQTSGDQKDRSTTPLKFFSKEHAILSKFYVSDTSQNMTRINEKKLSEKMLT